MRKALLLLMVVAVMLPAELAAQRERAGEEKFFDQLKSLFGRFREEDLRRSFDRAAPLQCSDLTSDPGEWRPVAFFNEDRKLGDWYYRSLAEVKMEFSVFTFEGHCDSNQSNVRLITKFPVRDSLDRYAAGRLPLKDVQVKTNAPVTASFNVGMQSYRFELPYLYSSVSARTAEAVYSLYPPRAADRYATNVTNHWDCKSVRATDVTFQFMICETATLPRDVRRGREGDQTFGTYAYFILSDGKEALTSTRLVFSGSSGSSASSASSNEEKQPAATEPDRVAGAITPEPPGRDAWQIPAQTMKLIEVDRSEFRIRFNPQTWANKINVAQILSDQKLSPLDPAKLPSGVDYCAWRPTTPSLISRLLSNEPDADVSFVMKTTDGSRSAPASIDFEMKTLTGSRIGTLQCVFARTEFADSVPIERWVSAVGGHLTMEIHP
jgi:hypothetical protein